MENKDVEKLLKESAEEIKADEFAEIWKDVSARINSAREVELKETSSETVLATNVNTNILQNSLKKKIVYSVCAVFLLIVICLAIVLPLTLKKNDKIYFDLNKLHNETVTESEFFNNIEEADLKIVNIEKYEIYSYTLLYTDDNIVVGGKLEIADEADGVYAIIVFYGTTVTSSFGINEDYKSYDLNGFKIEYKTELDEEENYSTKAKAVGTSINYEFECWSLDENIETFFNKLLG